jgi:hypothetical protein
MRPISAKTATKFCSNENLQNEMICVLLARLTVAANKRVGFWPPFMARARR